MLFVLALEGEKSLQHLFGFLSRETLGLELFDNLILARDVLTSFPDVPLHHFQFGFVALHAVRLAAFSVLLYGLRSPGPDDAQESLACLSVSLHGLNRRKQLYFSSPAALEHVDQ